MVKEKWAFHVDTADDVLLSSRLLVAGHAPLHLTNLFSGAGVGPSAWWYWCTSEEAIALA
jgi:hypothetical protein